MDANSSEIDAKLSEAIAALQSIRVLINAGPREFPADAQAKLSGGVCLVCGRKIKASDNPVRGTHERCYRRVVRAIEAGKTTEADAVANGLIAPKKKTGRKAKTGDKLDSHLAAMEHARDSVAAIEDLAEQVTKRKKR